MSATVGNEVAKLDAGAVAELDTNTEPQLVGDKFAKLDGDAISKLDANTEPEPHGVAVQVVLPDTLTTSVPIRPSVPDADWRRFAAVVGERRVEATCEGWGGGNHGRQGAVTPGCPLISNRSSAVYVNRWITTTICIWCCCVIERQHGQLNGQ